MSYSSTAAFLTNISNKYTNFFRTVPSDEIQVEVSLLHILCNMLVYVYFDLLKEDVYSS
jgi:hypothetical protein